MNDCVFLSDASSAVGVKVFDMVSPLSPSDHLPFRSGISGGAKLAQDWSREPIIVISGVPAAYPLERKVIPHFEST